MRRTNVYLAEDQLDALHQLAAQEGRSRAEVIRRLIDAALAGGERDLATDLAAIDASFGVCRQDHLDVDRANDERSAYLDTVWERSSRSWSAGTAEASGLELATLNLKHYPMFPDLIRPFSP